jgi:hypothetical protein
MFALNIPSTFGDTIDCRINGKPKRVTWRDEHTLVIKADPYAIAPVDTDKFGANWTGLEAFARQSARRAPQEDQTWSYNSKNAEIAISPKSRAPLLVSDFFGFAFSRHVLFLSSE